MSKSILVTCHSAPYGCSRAREAIDFILTAAAYEQPISVLLTGDALFLLVSNQQGSLLGQRSISSMLEAFPLYGIEQVYVASESLEQYGLAFEELALVPTCLSNAEINNLIQQHDCVLNF